MLLHKYDVGYMIFMIYQPIRACDIYYSVIETYIEDSYRT